MASTTETSAADLPSVPDDEVEALCAPVFRFIEAQLANGDPTDAWRLRDWLANLAQYPGRMSCVALRLHGPITCGHRVFVEWVRLRLLGDSLGHRLAHVDTLERVAQVSPRLNVICTTTGCLTEDPRLSLFLCSDAPCSPDFEPYLDSARVQRAFYQALLAHKIEHYHIGCFSDFVAEFRSPRGAYGANMRRLTAPNGIF